VPAEPGEEPLATARRELREECGLTGGEWRKLAVFWTTPSGLDRARTWITRYVDEHAALVVIEGVGSYGAGLTGRVVNAGLTVVEPASIAAARCR